MRVESVGLPLRFILTGVAALLTGVSVLAARPEILTTYHYNQWAIAVTHVFTLGWISSIIMGAMYQLVPVALETRLYSARCARWQFWLHLNGTSGLIAMFWTSDGRHAGYMALVVAAGVSLFVYNLARTLRAVPRWNGIALGIASAMTWLSLALAAGAFIIVSKLAGFMPFDPVAQMHAHAHIGAVGFFVMMLVAVSYKLVPMFTLSEVRSERRVRLSIWLLNAGLALTIGAILVQARWRVAAALLIVAGLAVYLVEMASILRARQRRAIDAAVRQFLFGMALLVPVSIIGLVLSWPGLPANLLTTQLENVYGLLAFIGVLTVCIIGMLYKIVPFLVWYSSYSRHIGRFKVPALAELSSARLQRISGRVFIPGLLLMAGGTLWSNGLAVAFGACLILASLSLFVVNLGLMLRHLHTPRLQPFGARPKSPSST